MQIAEAMLLKYVTSWINHFHQPVICYQCSLLSGCPHDFFPISLKDTNSMSLKSVLLCFCSDSPSEIWLIRQFSHIQVLCWNAVIHRNVTFESFKLIY